MASGQPVGQGPPNPGSTIQIAGLAADTVFTIDGTNDNQGVILGNANNTLDDILGSIVFNSGGVNNWVQINDQGCSAGDNYFISPGVITEGPDNAFAAILNGVNQVALNTGPGNIEVTVDDPFSSLTLALTGTYTETLMPDTGKVVRIC